MFGPDFFRGYTIFASCSVSILSGLQQRCLSLLRDLSLAVAHVTDCSYMWMSSGNLRENSVSEFHLGSQTMPSSC